jgi:hypothetical protein
MQGMQLIRRIQQVRYFPLLFANKTSILNNNDLCSSVSNIEPLGPRAMFVGKQSLFGYKFSGTRAKDIGGHWANHKAPSLQLPGGSGFGERTTE